MCQLCFVTKPTDPNYIPLAKRYFVHQMMLNSVRNKDGWGVYAEGHVKKYAKTVIDDIGNFVRSLPDDILTTTPVLAHVRLASTNKGKVVDEFAHPFELSSIVLAHNGTLTHKTEAVTEDTIDSLMFANTLNNIIEKDKRIGFVDAIKRAYETYDGKFAFLINHKIRNDYYVIRGKTANLHQATVLIDDKPAWTIVNTEQDTLTLALDMLIAEALLQGITLSWEINELDKETIYKVQHDHLVKVGELPETVKPFAYANNTTSRNSTNHASTQQTILNDNSGWGVGDINYFRIRSADPNEVMYKFVAGLSYHGVSLEEIRALFYMLYGKDIVDIAPLDVRAADLKALLKEFTSDKATSWTNVKNKFFSKNPDSTIFDLYRKTGIQFPFWLSTSRALKKAEKRV